MRKGIINMKNSYSIQARRLADRVYEQVVAGLENNELFKIDNGHEYIDCTPEQWASYVFRNSYRHPIVRERAAKRYGKKLREYKKRKLAN
jgi:hypothetical protein